MSARFEFTQLARRTCYASGTLNVIKGDQSVSIADVEDIVDHGHAKRLILLLQIKMAFFCDTIFVIIAKQHDSVGGFSNRGCTTHGTDHGVVEGAFDCPWGGQCFGDKYIVVGQHVYPARVFKILGERIHHKAFGSRRRMSVYPATCCWHFESRYRLRLGIGNMRCTTNCRLVSLSAPASHQYHAGAYHCDQSGK